MLPDRNEKNGEFIAVLLAKRAFIW